MRPTTRLRRRSNAVTITHLTPPLQSSGLYRGLADLKVAKLITAQANAVDLNARDMDGLWLKLLETEDALIPDGLHIVGGTPSAASVEDMLNLMGTPVRTLPRIMSCPL